MCEKVQKIVKIKKGLYLSGDYTVMVMRLTSSVWDYCLWKGEGALGVNTLFLSS